MSGVEVRLLRTSQRDLREVNVKVIVPVGHQVIKCIRICRSDQTVKIDQSSYTAKTSWNQSNKVAAARCPAGFGTNTSLKAKGGCTQVWNIHLHQHHHEWSATCKAFLLRSRKCLSLTSPVDCHLMASLSRAPSLPKLATYSFQVSYFHPPEAVSLPKRSSSLILTNERESELFVSYKCHSRS